MYLSEKTRESLDSILVQKIGMTSQEMENLPVEDRDQLEETLSSSLRYTSMQPTPVSIEEEEKRMIKKWPKRK